MPAGISYEAAQQLIKQNDDYCRERMTSIQTEKINLSDTEIENEWLSFIASQALSLEEYKTLIFKMEDDPELSTILRKVFLARAEFRGGGLVKGFIKYPYQADEVPAQLDSWGFVIRAKAVRQIGADVLQKMLKDAEAEVSL